jgi:hypothetical protein
MKKIIAFAVAAAAIGAFVPAMSASAATYKYVDVAGYVRAVEALNAEQALAMPEIRLSRSGVKLMIPNTHIIPVGFHVPISGGF